MIILEYKPHKYIQGRQCRKINKNYYRLLANYNNWIRKLFIRQFYID